MRIPLKINYPDPTYRNNAILFSGEPIVHLPTARLFAYATHFDAHPMGLEWVDDQTCVFVFSSIKDAREAFDKLTKPVLIMSANAESPEDVTPMAIDDPADPDYTLAKPFPIALWPPEERINQTLGKGHGLKGPIRMRWAKVVDVKKKGAMQASQFYRKHGSKAGKELFNGRDLPPAQPPKRKRTEWLEEEERRKGLDKELDDFLAEGDEDEDVEHRDSRQKKRSRRLSRPRTRSLSQTPTSHEGPPSPPSKMRSDYIAEDGRTLLERTSLLRYHPLSSDPLDDTPDLASRLIMPLPRGRHRRRGDVDLGADMLSLGSRIGSREGEKLEWRRSNDTDNRTRRGGRRERERRGGTVRIGDRPKKTQQELDDELDEFLNGKD
jgi:hypothetical protein